MNDDKKDGIGGDTTGTTGTTGPVGDAPTNVEKGAGTDGPTDQADGGGDAPIGETEHSSER